MIVSDGLTWPAIVARRKSCTRRFWKPETAAKFTVGTLFDSFNTSPFVRGVRIARCRVTVAPVLERLGLMPDDDWHAEGFAYLNERPQVIPVAARKFLWSLDGCSFASFVKWRTEAAELEPFVMRYEIVSVERAALAALDRLLEASQPQ